MAAVNGRFYLAVTCFVCGLAFIFGWNISSVNAAKQDWNSYYNKSTYEDFYSTWVVGIMSIGAIVGAVLSGPISSKMGPKGACIAVSCLNLLGCGLIYGSYAAHPKQDFTEDDNYDASLEKVWTNRPQNEIDAEIRKTGDEAKNVTGKPFTLSQWKNDTNLGYSHYGFDESFPYALYLLAAGRLIIGVFVGLASAICPRYIIDISPKEIAGKIGVCNQLLITVGILAANLFGLEAIARSNSQLIFCFPAIFSIAFIAFLASGMLPESPKFTFICKNNESQAEEDLARIRSPNHDLQSELASYQGEKSQSSGAGETPISGLFGMAGIRWQLFTLIFMHIAQPMSGINAVFFYSDQIFMSMGVSGADLAKYAIALSTLNVAMTIISTAIIEKQGRKLLLLGGYVVATACMVALTFALSSKASTISLIALLGFIAGFAIGPGPIPWIYNSELFPANARTASGMVGCITNWGTNFVVAKFFVLLQQKMGPNVFFIFIIFSGVTIFYCYSIIPETKNKTGTQVYNMFAKKNGVSKEQDSSKPLTEMEDLKM